jgi:hypothetical protein
LCVLLDALTFIIVDEWGAPVKNSDFNKDPACLARSSQSRGD